MATKVAVGDDLLFGAVGWSYAGPIWTNFKESFAVANLFRRTLAPVGRELCQTPEQYKVWSQNLGHENVLTTFTIYGNVSNHRQARAICYSLIKASKSAFITSA